MSLGLAAEYPQWLRDVDGALPVRAQFVLTGNVRDLHLLPPDLPPPDPSPAVPPQAVPPQAVPPQAVPSQAVPSQAPPPQAPPPRGPAAGPPQARRLETIEALWDVLRRSGYVCLLVHDRVDHLRVYPPTDDAAEAARQVLGHFDAGREIGLERLAEVVRTVATTRQRRVAMVLDYAARLTVSPQNLQDDEHQFLVSCEKASHIAQPLFVLGDRPGPLYNPVFWIVSGERDLPAWLLLNNEGIKTVSVPAPDLDDRLRLARMLVPSLPGAQDAEPETLERAVARFADQSESMTLRSMLEISRLSIDRKLVLTQVEDAVRAYRVGMLDNPWKRPELRQRIHGGDRELGLRVLGQERAVRKVVDVLIRSATGLTAAHSSGSASRPRGILFFAGPTGVGKTELAKAVTGLVFGNENAYTRFDMSEFSAEHSEARLIGAPPGYVGHDAGGQLTNAVRQKPFSLVLFDEIEKAHPRILDKFLQILEDGRLTDGSGSTVHFSETLLVFTSNLGIYTEGPDGQRVLNVLPSTPRAELESRMRTAISDHFTLRLNRPELLNRIGDNIIVFDFITPRVGTCLVDLYLGNVIRRVRKELLVDLEIASGVRDVLVQRATADLSFGGRGIGSVLESAFVNPLARALFLDSRCQDGAVPGARIVVTDLLEGEKEGAVILA